MESVRPGRRGVVQGLLGAALAGFGVRRAAADQSGGATPRGTAATWTYRWHDRLASSHPVPRPPGLPGDFVPAGDHQRLKTQHWVRPKDWPVGPAIQSQDGRIISGSPRPTSSAASPGASSTRRPSGRSRLITWTSTWCRPATRASRLRTTISTSTSSPTARMAHARCEDDERHGRHLRPPTVRAGLRHA